MLQAPAAGTDIARTSLFVALGLVTVYFLVVVVRALRASAAAGESIKTPHQISLTSFIANFFDTLGVGSFAPTTAAFRQWRMVRDERIPGTLNIGYTLPTIAEAFIFTKIVPVDTMTLVLMIGAAILGAWLGASVICAWPRRRIQAGMGLALLGFAVILLVRQLNLTPGGTLLQLTGARLAIGVVANFMLGALMTLGIGLYAPCLILISLLGMNPTAAFPIMMGSCAFLMPFASARFARTGSFEPKALVGMLIAGVPAVLIAGLVVKSLPLYWVNWLVVLVATYAALSLLAAARRERNLAADATAAKTQPA
ncbi:MAG: sulfite exporter TauE/SafE family protein [Gemmatimonadales bacterium]